MTTFPAGPTAPRPGGDGRAIARNATLNLLGHVAPMIVAVAAIPPLIRGLGTERFGVLTLMWVVIGYFSLFDMGLGRAVTQLVAEKLGAGRDDEVPGIVWTALTLVLGFGAAGAAVGVLVAPWLVGQAADMPPALQEEALAATYLLALSLPAVVSTAALRGVLEAAQRFDLVNLLRVPLAIFSYAGPLAVLPFSRSLVPVVAVLLVGRIVGWAAHLALCLRSLPALRRLAFRGSTVPALLHFGGWTTASNIVSPVLVYLDRFLIGGLLSVAAVTFYATPFEVVTKLLVIPGALVGVFFPAFAATFSLDRARTIRLYGRTLRVVAVMMFPLMLTIIALAPEGLALWLGEEFSARSATVLRLLAAGVFVNALAQAPFSVIQAVGRPDLTGKLHLAELPLYLALLWWAVSTHGITGAAAAWSSRILVDAVALFLVADRKLGAEGATVRSALGMLAGAVLLFAVATMPPATLGRAVFLLIGLPTATLVGWRSMLQPEEREVILALLPGRGGGRKRPA